MKNKTITEITKLKTIPPFQKARVLLERLSKLEIQQIFKNTGITSAEFSRVSGLNERTIQKRVSTNYETELTLPEKYALLSVIIEKLK